MAPKAAQRAVLLDDESFATVLLLLVADTYGNEFLPNSEDPDGWTAETIKMQLEQDYGVRLPKDNLDKIMAAITILTTNFFWKDVNRFIELCNILAGDDFQPDEFEPADAGEILWGVTEASLIWPPDEDADDTEFSDEIRTYIGQVLRIEGISDPPDLLKLGLTGTAGQEIDDNFSDDPAMFDAVWDVQRSKTDELKQMVVENLQQLAFQLKVLPLQDGSKEETLKQIQEITGALPDEDSPLSGGESVSL